jgi:hypothetical protein
MIALSKVLPHMVAHGAIELAARHEEGHALLRDDAMAEGRRMAELAHAQETAKLISEHRTALERERAEWARLEGAAIAKAMSDRISETERQIAGAVSAIMQSIAVTELPKRALESLEQKIMAAVRRDASTRISLKGPTDLTAELARNLEVHGLVVAPPIEAAGEVMAEGPGFTVVSTLECWLKELCHG